MIPSAIAWLNNVFLRVFFRTVELSSTEDEDKSHMCLINCLYWPFFLKKKKGNALIVTKKIEKYHQHFLLDFFFLEMLAYFYLIKLHIPAVHHSPL